MARVMNENDADYDFIEPCPECGEDVEIVYDKEPEEDYGYEVVCPYCGAKMMLCMMCHDDYGEICDWSRENGCRISRKEFPEKRIWEEKE